MNHLLSPESFCFTSIVQRVTFVFRKGELVATFELARLLTTIEKDEPYRSIN